MSAEAPAPFSPRTILALVLVAVIAFSGFAVLAAFAPDLRAATNPGAQALSRSAVGFRGAVIMARALGLPASVARARIPAKAAAQAGLVATPGFETRAADLARLPRAPVMLIVLPKWLAAPDPAHPGWVVKAGAAESTAQATQLLAAYAPQTQVARRPGVSRPALRGAGGPFAAGTYLPLGRIDQLQTVSGPGWEPSLVDEQGRIVLAWSRRRPGVLLLADPDLLNTQGLADRDTARAGMAILSVARPREGPLYFDVTLNGLAQGRGLLRTLLEPPWLAATLCGVGAALLLGLHALARFGPARGDGRALAMGTRALVDNSAGLVRLAGKEAQLAPDYLAAQTRVIARAAGVAAAGADPDAWVAELARRRELSTPAELAQEARRLKGREAALAYARKLYDWRREMMRER